MRLADWQRCFQSITTPGALLAQIPKLGNRPRPRPRFIGLLRREKSHLLGNYFVPLV
jgi:hypothetical protein